MAVPDAPHSTSGLIAQIAKNRVRSKRTIKRGHDSGKGIIFATYPAVAIVSQILSEAREATLRKDANLQIQRRGRKEAKNPPRRFVSPAKRLAPRSRPNSRSLVTWWDPLVPGVPGPRPKGSLLRKKERPRPRS
ncbi:hypothetical protein KM043_014161 [Ampulex compressa]|nr:hypothetical protein KM043_014161 [Ampulex compressa]